jgi:catechol 2,3-dioxygenase-like lactoylglutathione lyase family enzyme
MAAMLADDGLISFVATTDLPRARDFYGGVLGLPLEDESPFALVFQENGSMLRITAVPELVPAPYTVLGWTVADIAATIRSLSQRGIAFEHFEGVDQDELGIWHAPSGARVAWFKDPDGNTLSLTQFF